jgi:hypothetical protein
MEGLRGYVDERPDSAASRRAELAARLATLRAAAASAAGLHDAAAARCAAAATAPGACTTGKPESCDGGASAARLPQAQQPARMPAAWAAHERAWAAFEAAAAADGPPASLASVPWPPDDRLMLQMAARAAMAAARARGGGGGSGAGSDVSWGGAYRAAHTSLLLRYHPDKFAARHGMGAGVAERLAALLAALSEQWAAHRSERRPAGGGGGGG